MLKDEELYRAVYSACLEAAKSMGDDLTTMSWFGKNVKSAKEHKLAA